ADMQVIRPEEQPALVSMGDGDVRATIRRVAQDDANVGRLALLHLIRWTESRGHLLQQVEGRNARSPEPTPSVGCAHPRLPPGPRRTTENSKASARWYSCEYRIGRPNSS